MRIIANSAAYDTEKVFQLDLSADDFNTIIYALAHTGERGHILGYTTAMDAMRLAEKFDALRQKFAEGLDWR